MVATASDLLGFFYTHSKCLERSWIVELPHSLEAVERLVGARRQILSRSARSMSIRRGVVGSPSFADRFLRGNDLAIRFRMGTEVLVVKPQVMHEGGELPGHSDGCLFRSDVIDAVASPSC